jgi:hypothetical protein
MGMLPCHFLQGAVTTHMNDFNILFTSAGRRVSLILNFRAALDTLGLKGKLVTADLQNNAPAPFVADVREQVAPRLAALLRTAADRVSISR